MTSYKYFFKAAPFGITILFSWRFYIHGAIDGYSRIIAFLTICPNNQATSVFDGFLAAVEKFGLPSRVR